MEEKPPIFPSLAAVAIVEYISLEISFRRDNLALFEIEILYYIVILLVGITSAINSKSAALPRCSLF